MFLQKAEIVSGQMQYNKLGLLMPSELSVQTIELLRSLVNVEHFVFVQNSPSALWIITHALNKRPSVNCEDLSGTDMEGSIEYIDNTQLKIHWLYPTSGRAYLN